jgi:hypothetical protein
LPLKSQQLIRELKVKLGRRNQSTMLLSVFAKTDKTIDYLLYGFLHPVLTCESIFPEKEGATLGDRRPFTSTGTLVDDRRRPTFGAAVGHH